MLVLLQPLGQLQCVFRVPFTPQAQRLNPQQQLLCCEWIQCTAEISQNLNPQPDRKRDRPKGVPELQTVVAFGRIVELGEPFGVFAPIELAAVNNDAPDGGSVTPNPFGSRVYHDIRAVINWSAEITPGAKGVVHHDRHALLMGHFHNGFEVWNVVPWIADAFNVNSLRLVVDQLVKVLGLVAFGEFGGDAEARVEDLELVVGSAIEIRSRNDVIA